MFKKIVQFKNGKYGIRRWVFGYEFLDLQNKRSWRKLNSSYFKDCQGTFQEALEVIDTGKSLSKKQIDQGRVVSVLKGNTDESTIKSKEVCCRSTPRR